MPAKKIYQTSSGEIAFDLCVEFSRWCLVPFTTRINEWTDGRMNEWIIVCLWRWIYLEIEVILHHRKFDPQTNRTWFYMRIYTNAHKHTYVILIFQCTHMCMYYMFQPWTIDIYYILVFIAQGTYNLTFERAHTGMWPGHNSHSGLLASDKNKMDSHLFEEIFPDERGKDTEREGMEIVRVNDITYLFIFFW